MTASVDKLLRCARVLAVGGLLISLGACASGAMPSQMAVSADPALTMQASDPVYHQLKVGNVQGGSDTNPLWMSNVSNADFQAALESSLRNVNLMSDDLAKANLAVSANIIDMQRPLAGLDMTVTAKVRYTVAPAAGGAPVFDDTVAVAGTAKFGDALLGEERLRMAEENAVRANIAEFLRRFEATLKAKSAG